MLEAAKKTKMSSEHISQKVVLQINCSILRLTSDHCTSCRLKRDDQQKIKLKGICQRCGYQREEVPEAAVLRKMEGRNQMNKMVLLLSLISVFKKVLVIWSYTFQGMKWELSSDKILRPTTTGIVSNWSIILHYTDVRIKGNPPSTNLTSRNCAHWSTQRP